jgi:predicted DsbA family dithiol-disulfide isomerase/uncharacterized membrane protein
MNHRSLTRRTLLAALALGSALAGAGLSALIHARQLGLGEGLAWLAALCGPAGASGCDLAQRSPAAQPFGLSLALIGCAYYGALFLAGVAALAFASRGTLAFLFLLAALGLVVDAGLASYSLFVLGGLCGLCVATYAATTVAALTAFAWLRASERGLVPARRFPRRELLAFGAVAALALLAGTGWLAARATPLPPAAFVQDPDRALRVAWDAFHAHFHAAPALTLETRAAPRKGAVRPVLELVLFADFACSHCERAVRLLGEFVERHRQEVALVFKHYPLDSECNPQADAVHKGACLLARAAGAAAEQRQFWRFAELLFAEHERWRGGVTSLELGPLALRAGLDPEVFQAALASEPTRAALAADLAEAKALGVTGTPTLFINGRRMPSIPITTFLEELLVAEREERPNFSAPAYRDRGASE